jgi:hypothetical protein
MLRVTLLHFSYKNPAAYERMWTLGERLIVSESNRGCASGSYAHPCTPAMSKLDTDGRADASGSRGRH